MKKILFIEDDQTFANVYRNKLVLDGFQVEIASDGEEGLEMMRSFRPDAVLLDLILPKLAGVDLIKKLRSEPDFQQTPVVVLTSTYLTSTLQDAWKAGATKCLAKANCTPAQVIGTLSSLLNGNGSTKPNGVAHAAPDAAPVTDTAAGQSDDEFAAELRKQFLDSIPSTMASLRNGLQGLAKTSDQQARVEQLQQMYRRVHSLTGNSGIVGLPQVSRLSDALEILLKELVEKPKSINASTLRTVANAVDCLAVLLDQRTGPGKDAALAKILVVDDEVISRRAITYALDKAKLKTVNVEDPLQALDLVNRNTFDLIFLDVDMPNMNGFELCAKIRALPGYKTTPVVFITSLTDFESRANSMISGGNDFIAKPFQFIELAVKALVYVLRGPAQPAKA